MYLSIHLNIYFNPQKILTHAYIPYHIEIGPKCLGAETTQDRNDPPTKAETTHP